MCIISRRSCRRPGVRYETRGVDALGNVANFVETEFFVWREAEAEQGAVKVASFVIIRGSVPVYWHQPLSVMRFGVQYDVATLFPPFCFVTLSPGTTPGRDSTIRPRRLHQHTPRT
jgi:hypothetical protein